MTFGTDNTTGIYSSGAGTVNIATGGTNRVTVRADGDLDLTGSVRQNGDLFLHSLGFQSIAVGSAALTNNTGHGNTASGYHALYSNTGGVFNTASGYGALYSNITGNSNTASGASTLYNNTTGNGNTASGIGALSNNTTGSANTANGWNALLSNITGSSNVAVGINAGISLTTGDNNIIIGNNNGSPGMANTTIIGDGSSQNRVFITGIRGIQTGSADAQSVMIDSNGQLGTIDSSRRFKEDIQDLGEASSKLMQLRPVSYRYKQPYADGAKPIDYGLIAEEVEAVYPDLIAKDKDGEVQSVQYHKLIPMLLNELKKEHREMAAVKDELAALKAALNQAK
jgi:hypothetical protein